MRILNISLLILTIFIISCTGEKRDIEEAVIEYNKTLIEAYLRGDASLISPYASSREKSRIEQYILFLLKENKVIRCNFEDIRFINIRIDGKKAHVETEEKWDFEYLDAKTRIRIKEPGKVRYKGKYKMEKRDREWIVSLLEEAKEIK